MVLYAWMMIQVIIECLPMSSSGHIYLFEKIVTSFDCMIVSDQMHHFDYAVQGVSAILFLLFFFQAWWDLIFGQNFSFQNFYNCLFSKKLLNVLIFGIIVDGLTLGFWLIDLQSYINIPLWFGFLITGLSLWSLQRVVVFKNKSLWDLQDALGLGIAQGIALFPGISRFGLTMTYLQWRGYNSLQAWYISFLVQFPLLCAGSLLGFLQLSDPYIVQTITAVPFLISTILVAFIAWTVLQYLKKIVATHQLWKFSYYMVIPFVGALYF